MEKIKIFKFPIKLSQDSLHLLNQVINFLLKDHSNLSLEKSSIHLISIDHIYFIHSMKDAVSSCSGNSSIPVKITYCSNSNVISLKSLHPRSPRIIEVTLFLASLHSLLLPVITLFLILLRTIKISYHCCWGEVRVNQ